MQWKILEHVPKRRVSSSQAGTVLGEFVQAPQGCGKILTATASFQTLEDTVVRYANGNKSNHSTYEYMHFARRQLTASPKDFSVDGCYLARVEMKTGSDKRHTGYRFCSPGSAGTNLNSTHNVIPIITYSRSRDIKTVLRYRICTT
ncbi:unnamed protein product [Angiostrongylus costaricensis]|uniref:Uncharacterized protein n=1 Tax=Angiostrongylus costaricensis TaxID=334426 RepID=A0A0R3PHT7_ANGCS|nr:unnamed protein product [Angiostrongylus costaricensis]